MIVKACYKSKDFSYFTDKENGLERHYGDIFECDDEIATERIKNKFVKKATKEEEKEYYANQIAVDEDNLKPSNNGISENNTGNNAEADNNEGELPKNDDEYTEIKSFLEECTKEELIGIAFKEDICIDEHMSEEQLVETINKVRAERLEQSNN